MVEEKHEPLPYAEPGTSARRPIPVRRLVFLTVVVTLATAAWRFGPDLAAEWRAMSLKRQWANCSMPADLVVFDTAVQKAPPTRPVWFGDEKTVSLTGYSPPCRYAVSGSRSVNTATIFMHRLRSPGGHERFICLDVNAFDCVYSDHTDRVVRLVPTVGRPAAHSQIGCSLRAPWYIDYSLADHLRFFAGQADPANPSHFSFGYVFNGVPGKVDAFLQDDDSIRFVPDRGTGDRYDPRRPWSFGPPVTK